MNEVMAFLAVLFVVTVFAVGVLRMYGVRLAPRARYGDPFRRRI